MTLRDKSETACRTHSRPFRSEIHYNSCLPPAECVCGSRPAILSCKLPERNAKEHASADSTGDARPVRRARRPRRPARRLRSRLAAGALLAVVALVHGARRPHGRRSKGVEFDFRHLAPTPEGGTVTATAEVTGVEGRLVTFAIEAHDDTELVGKGTHVRAVIEMQRFARRIRRKME